MTETIINEINKFLTNHNWCDFEIIELKGNLKIGGKTSFDNKYDITITFEDVFFIQCNYKWQTDTSESSFFIPNIDERSKMNIDFSIDQGYTLFKILAEDIDKPFYISSKNISLEILKS